jgi:hypothetical protein
MVKKLAGKPKVSGEVVGKKIIGGGGLPLPPGTEVDRPDSSRADSDQLVTSSATGASPTPLREAGTLVQAACARQGVEPDSLIDFKVYPDKVAIILADYRKIEFSYADLLGFFGGDGGDGERMRT